MSHFKVLCMYCRGTIREEDKDDDGVPAVLSHGVCPDCVPRFLEAFGVTMAEFLDRLEVPILVVDENVRILTANAGAERLLGKPIRAIAGCLAGNAIECLHSSEPGGCGQTIHCQSCTIRHSVARTVRTGMPCKNVPAYADIGILNANRSISFLISTERRGEVVLLHIDPVGDAPAPLQKAPGT